MIRIDNTIPNLPFGELGIIALDSVKDIGYDIDQYVVHKRKERQEDSNMNGLFTEDTKDSYLIDFEITRFSDGEAKCLIKETVRGKDIYIICDIGNYSNTYTMFGKETCMGPDEHLQDIKRVVSAIGGKARRISVLMPRLYASRQDTRNSRESLDCAMALQELERLGVENILTFDAHSSKVQNAIPQCGFENFFASYNILQKLLLTEPDVKVDQENMMVIAPDPGAMDRSIYYANVLGVDVGMFYKRRDLTKVVDGGNPIIEHEYVGEEVVGKDLLIVDDMIASGGTVFDLLERLREMGARRVYIAVTFALFTTGIDRFKENYQRGLFTKLFSTNLSYLPEHIQKEEWYENVDMSKFIGKLLNLLNYDNSASSFFDDTSRINKMLESRAQNQ